VSLPWSDPEHNVLDDVLKTKDWIREHLDATAEDLARTDPKDIFGTYVSTTSSIPLKEEVAVEEVFEPGTLMDSMPLGNSHEPDVDESDGVAIVSGGLDSVTMVYWLMNHGKTPHLLSFDYGQRHGKELNFALWHAEQLGLRWSLIDLSSITDLISNSALTAPPRIVLPPYEEDKDSSNPLKQATWASPEKRIEVTVVPNRNMMMLSIATAVAVSNSCTYVAAGMHAGDHFQYPDCRIDFLDSMETAIHIGNEGFALPDFGLIVPWIEDSKDYVAQQAFELGVPLHMTWTCYKGGKNHCGRCGTCVERLEAIASVTKAPKDWDQTVYDDTEFWKQAKAEYESSKQ
jgi:7-cyano-7-deazaguanine synthase